MGNSWSIKEKLDVAVSLISDRRFTYAERVVGVSLVLYYHNTQSGDLFPSRAQVMERTGVGRKETVISTTRKMKLYGYVDYKQSTGGRNERNTYHLLKNGHKKGTVSEVDTVTKKGLGGSHFETRAGHKKGTRIYPSNLPEKGEALPSPCYGRASASKEKEGIQGKVAGEPSFPTTSEREAQVEAWENKFGRKFKRRR